MVVRYENATLKDGIGRIILFQNLPVKNTGKGRGQGQYGFDINHTLNLKKLPVPFHLGSHPSYTNYVADRIIRLGHLYIHKLKRLENQLRQEINQVYFNYFKTGKVKNLNDYYKQLGY